MHTLLSSLLCLVLLFTGGLLPSLAADSDRQLRRAQKLLAAGDYSRAYQAYHNLAQESDHPLAQFSLALFHENGWGRPVDPRAACRWYGTAAQGEVPAAAHFYAECLAAGTVVPGSAGDVIYWYEQAIALGHGGSHYPLGQLLLASERSKDREKALLHLTQAASLGNQQAQFQLGRFFHSGDKVEPDHHQAYQWYLQAAQQGNRQAQYWLAMLLRDSPAAELQSAEQALRWFESAAAQGYLPAYLPTAQAYLGGTGELPSQQIPAPALAKAYLWLSAAVSRRSGPEEQFECKALLDQVLVRMPKTWRPALDRKVSSHLRQFED